MWLCLHFANDLDDDGIESNFINFTESTRLGEDSSSVKSNFRISNGLEKKQRNNMKEMMWFERTNAKDCA